MATITKSKVEILDSIMDYKDQEKLWYLYHTAFRKLNENSPSRQSFTMGEFMKLMGDGEMTKFILRDIDGKIVGLGLATNNLSKVPWISQDFFRKRYPLHFENRIVYYIECLVVSGGLKPFSGLTLLASMIDYFPGGSVGCFDFSERNNGSMPIFVERAGAKKAKRGTLLDRQVYYAFEKDT